MYTPLNDKWIVLGVTGSIAAYKIVELASSMTKLGANVDVVLSPAAEKFVSALTFRSVTEEKFIQKMIFGISMIMLYI